MNQAFFDLLLFIGLVYLLGFNILVRLIKAKSTPLNLFLKLGFSWVIGNFSLMFLVTGLAYLNNLPLINRTNFYGGSLLLLVATGVWLIKKNQTVPFQTKSCLQDLIIFLLIIFFFLKLMVASLTTPMLSFDALAMWFLKAKSFFYHSGFWDNQLFYNSFFNNSNKTYPIGFSLIVASYWRIINFANDQTIQFYLLFFYLNSLFLFIGCLLKLSHCLHRINLLLLSLSLFTIPIMVIYSHNGYADLPLALIILSTIVVQLILLVSEPTADYFYLLLIILSSGVLYKNEGFVWLIIGLFSSLIIYWFRFPKEQKKVNQLCRWGIVLIVCLIPYLLWHYFLSTIKAPFYLNSGTLTGVQLTRLKFLFNMFCLEIINTSKYGILLIAYLLIGSVSWTAWWLKRHYLLFLPLFCLAAQLAGYFYVYLITTMPFELQLTTSLERLILHLLPGFFLVVSVQALLLLESVFEKKKTQ
jgi:hypothetical protein